TRAEAIYRRAIDSHPESADSLHMLGVLQYERMRYGEALGLLWDAAERTSWTNPMIRRNLGLVLAKFLSPQADPRQEALVAEYTACARARQASPALAVLVSVVLPVCNRLRFVARAIASVAAQSYTNIELVVVDDGSTGDTAVTVSDCLAGFAFPARLVRSGHRGAASAANEGAEKARGRYLAFLDADDWFAPERIERMVAEIARPAPLWGFSRVGYEGDGTRGGGSPGRSAPPPQHFPSGEPASFALLGGDVTGASGNLFIDRELFRMLGGFRDVAQHRGWDFSVRAAEVVEPVAVAQRLYFRGSDDRSPGSGLGTPDPGAIDRMAAEFLADALTRDAPVTNEFCPQFVGNRDLLLCAELRAGRGDRIPVPILQALAGTWRTRATTPMAAERNPSRTGHPGKTALVVLGIYRSGTSAMSRALNLCGAYLPKRVVAARLGINPKGFWETEAVNHLNARLLLHLGTDWKRVDFDLPREGPLVDEFLNDAHELLATEYGDAPLILIKDPRICVLAPLWDRAMKESGYRPAYVVPVRNPLEVARSLESQGDMPVADGLALWLAYMQRVETFVGATDARVVHVRYAALLADWRGVVGRIAQHLDVPLAIDRRADDVDSFLEAGMHNHQASDAELESHLDGVRGEAIRALYRRLLERCERDAGAGEGSRIIPAYNVSERTPPDRSRSA
ncbi:MAG TPA: glycosyltransferase, partial [Casimicrobiaceae bacterium]|nr:glycosyltransferase [Casimicrobiaceae bacterium]